MKCLLCINELLNGEVITDSTPVQHAVDGARTAVTIIGGTPVCTEHLYTKMVNSALDGLNK